MLFITNESESGLNGNEMMNWQSLTLSLQGRLKVKNFSNNSDCEDLTSEAKTIYQ